MEVTGGPEEGFIREWTPCAHILNLIPPRIQNGLFSNELCLTCVDAVSEYIALGTNVGLVYWYDRKKGNIQRLRCENTTSAITFVKIVSTVDYMVGAGNAAGQVTVFQIPKEHPENVPDTFKPKVEPKVERYTIGDLHKGPVTAIEWSKNGMRLFSGDKNGVIIMTEIDFYMHLCKSMEIVNEEHEIVQMSYHQSTLLVSSVYRTILCERRDARWAVSQLGKKERKSLCALGAVFVHSYALGGEAAVYCARPGLRVWRADTSGNVMQTLLFKEAIANPLTVAELLNPARRGQGQPGPGQAQGQGQGPPEPALGPLRVFREQFLVAHDARALYVLDPRALTAVAVVDQLRSVVSVAVTRDEVFVLEGPRSLLRLAPAPEPAALADVNPILMSKSLTSSLQQAVNTVRDLTPVHYISSVLEQPIAMITKNEVIDSPVASAEECFELPPLKKLPQDISENVLESIINEFKETSEADEVRRVKSEELQRKLKLYNSIMERKCEEELIHSSRRSRRREGGSGGSTPRFSTPVRRPDSVSYTSPCLMNISVYGDVNPNDDLLEQQIEEKEKILAKMLNLDSLSITPKQMNRDPIMPTYTKIEVTSLIEPEIPRTPAKLKPVSAKVNPGTPVKVKTVPNPIDLVPKVVKLPNNWNLGDIELELEEHPNGVDDLNVTSPDYQLDSDWEII